MITTNEEKKPENRDTGIRPRPYFREFSEVS